MCMGISLCRCLFLFGVALMWIKRLNEINHSYHIDAVWTCFISVLIKLIYTHCFCSYLIVYKWITSGESETGVQRRNRLQQQWKLAWNKDTANSSFSLFLYTHKRLSKLWFVRWFGVHGVFLFLLLDDFDTTHCFKVSANGNKENNRRRAKKTQLNV